MSKYRIKELLNNHPDNLSKQHELLREILLKGIHSQLAINMVMTVLDMSSIIDSSKLDMEANPIVIGNNVAFMTWPLPHQDHVRKWTAKAE